MDKKFSKGRYVDLSITTPLLLLELGVIAGLRPKLIAGVMGADLFMILTGMIASFESPPNSYIWYIISCGAFLAILVSLLSEFSDSARRRNGKVNSLFCKATKYTDSFIVLLPDCLDLWC